MALLNDPDLGVRTEALLYLSRERGIDPLAQIEKLGDFADFSIRAGMAAFLASPGPAQNLDAARAHSRGHGAHADGPDGGRERAEAARLIALVPDAFLDLLPALLADPTIDVARAGDPDRRRAMVRDEHVEPLIARSAAPRSATRRPARWRDSATASSRDRSGGCATKRRRRTSGASCRRCSCGSAPSRPSRSLIGSLLQADPTLRHRVIASLNKLRTLHPEVQLDPAAIELLLAAEIVGHYRSYQVLGPAAGAAAAGRPGARRRWATRWSRSSSGSSA